MSINELFVETPKEKVEGFIKSLHPIKTEHELVRWGAKHDGGYLIPNDFEGIRELFSPGVGGESAFEEDFYRHCKPTNPNDIYIYIYIYIYIARVCGLAMAIYIYIYIYIYIWQTNRSMSRY